MKNFATLIALLALSFAAAAADVPTEADYGPSFDSTATSVPQAPVDYGPEFDSTATVQSDSDWVQGRGKYRVYVSEDYGQSL